MRLQGPFLSVLAVTLALIGCDDGVAPDREEEAPRFERIVAGDFHTCALRNDGVVYCWGFNDTGALGIAPGASDGTPVRVPLTDSVESIVARGATTCALFDGEAWCWGSLPGGQSAPTRVGPNIEWQSMTPGHKYEYAYLCGVSTAGDTYCWGAEGAHLGLGPDATADEPTLVEGSDWRTISANRFPGNPNFYPEAATTCATKSDGSGYCWGFVATGASDPRWSDIPESEAFDTPVLVDGSVTWATLQPGLGFVCGIADSVAAEPGRVYCWGTIGGTTYPVVHGTDFIAERLAAGGTHACRVDNPWLSCWGGNDRGQLGTGDLTDDPAGSHVDPSMWWVDVAAGSLHTCGLTHQGEIYCWGGGTRNQMGDGWQVDRLSPVRVRIPDEDV